ncbi:hypothetical protein DL96DRAFT_1606230 [Flagelloscypha sp. PMI_526]|nr:hypothetical protein DL96DRAFT_1606230 [Flagelloscypha sp. PMI_526]
MTALAVACSDSLVAIPDIKKVGPRVSSLCSLPAEPVAIAWSKDNAALYTASEYSIQQCSSSGSEFANIFNSTEVISSLITLDKSTIAVAAGQEIHQVDCTSKDIVRSWNTHDTPITSLSLSNDGTLLASTSSNSVHVQDLASNTHIALRGLSSLANSISTCAFHPHIRTRLLVASSQQIAVYDTTRPSTPTKVVPLASSSVGDIVAVACSPFSKTLVAVSTSGGTVGLVDLDKEKGLFKTINLDVEITSTVFSPEGAAICFGTSHGEVLVLDLRGLDKPPRVISVSEAKVKIMSMSMQCRARATKPPASSSSKPTLSASTATSRRTSATSASPSPKRSTIASRSSASKQQATRPDPKRLFSPVRDPLGNSTSNKDVSTKTDTKSVVKPVKSTLASARLSVPEKVSASPKGKDRVPAAMKSSVTRSSSSLKPTVTSRRGSATATPNSGDSATLSSQKTMTASLSATSGATSGVARRERSGSNARSSASRPSSSTSNHRPNSRATTSAEDHIPPVPPIPSHAAIAREDEARTPSPEFPSMTDLDSPSRPIAKNAILQSVSSQLDNAIVDRNLWKGKVDGEEEELVENITVKKHRLFAPQPANTSMEISPRKPSAMTSAPPGWATSVSAGPSPLRRAAMNMNIPNSPGGTTPQDFLRAVVRDAMLDLHAENRAEMTGLHLDLVRLGRTWKKEMRELMDEYVGDLRELREENGRLREENERLKRGY